MPFLYPLLAQAQTIPFQDNEVSFGWVLFKTMAILLFVIALALVFIRVILPKLQGGRNFETQSIRILGKVALDARKALFLVQVGKKTALIGASEQGINKIFDLDEPDLREEK